MPLEFNEFSKKTPIDNEKLYKKERARMMIQIEESGAPKLEAYVDSEGLPTIGIGMNLSVKGDVLNEVLDTILGKIDNSGDLFIEDKYRKQLAAILATQRPITHNKTVKDKQNTDLREALDAIMVNRAADPRITFTDKRTTFTFTDSAEVETVFNSLAPDYESKIDSRIGNIDTVPYSYERLALFSLAYNRPTLLGADLKAAIIDGNRPEAWYQIRYLSNKAKDHGLAKRRYYESQIFGLYNDRTLHGDVSDAEAISVENMFNSRASDMVKYDAQTFATKDRNGVVTTHKFSEMVAAANRDFAGIALGENGQVQTRLESIARSRRCLVNSFIPGKKVNQIAVARTSDGAIVGASSVSDPRVIPAKTKSSSNQNLQSLGLSSSHTSEVFEEIESYSDAYYQSDDALGQAVDDHSNYYYQGIESDDGAAEVSEIVNTLLIGTSASDTFYLPFLSGCD